MKNLVLLWGWTVFIPLLAPVIALPLLLLIGRSVRSLSARVNTALLFFVFSLSLAAVAYGNLRYGRELYFDFLKNKGETHLAKVADIRRASALTGATTTEIDLIFKSNVTGETTATVPLNTNRIFPDLDSLDLPPEIGDTMLIYVYPQAAQVLMIDADPKKSSYGAKLQCSILQQRFEKTRLRMQATGYPTRDVKEPYIQAIKDLLETNCPNLEQRNHLRGILSTIQ